MLSYTLIHCWLVRLVSGVWHRIGSLKVNPKCYQNLNSNKRTRSICNTRENRFHCGGAESVQKSARVNIGNLFILRFSHSHQIAASPSLPQAPGPLPTTTVNHYLRLSTKQAAALYHIRSDTVYLRNLFSSRSLDFFSVLQVFLKSSSPFRKMEVYLVFASKTMTAGIKELLILFRRVHKEFVSYRKIIKIIIQTRRRDATRQCGPKDDGRSR